MKAHPTRRLASFIALLLLAACGSASPPLVSPAQDASEPRDAHFRDWPTGADPATVGALVARVFDGIDLDGSKHYKMACAWYGSLAVAALLKDQSLLDALIAKYAPYRNGYAELLQGRGHVDDNVFGIVPLEIARHLEDPAVLAEGLSIADHQGANIASQKRIAIDDMFMVAALQVQAYRASGAQRYLDVAASAMVEYLDALQQDDGLFFHHRDFRHKWARGNGWVAAGMTELLRELPPAHPDHAAIRRGYERMMRGLAEHQIEDGEGAGLWKQVLDSNDARNWAETSGSAMFTYALTTGVRSGWLDAETFGPVARAGWLALVGRLTGTGELQDVSDWAYKPFSHPGGPSYAGDEENYYFQRPRLTGDNHGQAPVLWSAAALLR